MISSQGPEIENKITTIALILLATSQHSNNTVTLHTILLLDEPDHKQVTLTSSVWQQQIKVAESHAQVRQLLKLQHEGSTVHKLKPFCILQNKSLP